MVHDLLHIYVCMTTGFSDSNTAHCIFQQGDLAADSRHGVKAQQGPLFRNRSN